MCSFTTVHQNAQCIAQYILNWDLKAKNKYYTLLEKFHCLVKTKYILDYVYCELFVALFVVLMFVCFT